jgi:hypothetical protein
MLFRLNLQKAVVADIPMDARYADESSSMQIHQIVGEFLFKHLRNFGKRIFYNYYLRDMSLASIELPLGLILFLFGTIFGTVGLNIIVNKACPKPKGTRGQMLI